ncbi:BTAD domain-containing putative transcriptional regulator [Kutzneria sp. NPDC052558]|uniref:AfsR/SARP family transcriptional regulator n=1 Tax=Kutzneria sp. NPDC052558 TaxID=3364121 RepID=UPI0037C6D1F2
MELRFGVLGPLLVWRGSTEVRLGSAKNRQVLGLLLLHANHYVDREQIIDCAWGERPPRSAVNLVQKYVGDVRRSLGPSSGVIDTVGAGYQLNISPEQLDSARFAADVVQARESRNGGDFAAARSSLTGAMALWRGPAFSGIDTPAADTERTRLDEYRLGAIEDLAELDLLMGQHGLAVAELTRVVTAHPFRERARELLMIGLYRGGRPADALVVYQDVRRLLAEELGASPGQGLQRVHGQVLRADPALDLVTAVREPRMRSLYRLPPDIADFTGREQTRRTVLDLARARRVTVIVGAPGTGKSTLAIRVAHELRESYPDGQLYVDLAGTSDTPRTPARVLAEMLRALGVNDAVMPDGMDERAGLYRARLAGRRVLVLLDDAADARQVRPLLPPSGDCAVVVTSRRWLTDLEGAQHVELDVLSPADARMLLAGIVGAERAEQEPETSDAIVRLCGHLPLAIRIAGAKLASRGAWTLGVLRGRLEDESQRLRELCVGDLDVRASFELSVRLLPEPAARAFRLLGLLGAETLPGWVLGPLIDEPDAEDMLDALVDANLLRLVETDAVGQPRYRLHDLLRAHATREAVEQYPIEERRAAVERVLAGWLAVAEQARALCPPGLFRHTPGNSPRRPAGYVVTDAISWFDAERGTLLQAMSLAAQWEFDTLAWELALAAVPYYDHRSLYQDWRRSHEIALAAARTAGNGHGVAALLQGLGQVHIYLDEMDDARTALDESLDLYRGLGDQRGEALALAGVATVERVLGHDNLALKHGYAALELASRVDLPHLRAQLLAATGLFQFESTGEDTGPRIEDGLRRARQLGDRHREAVILRYLSSFRQANRDYAAALRCLTLALTVFSEIADERCAAYTEQRIGGVYAELDDHLRARAALQRAAGVFHGNGDRKNEADCLERLGELERRHGTPATAREHLDNAARLRKAIAPKA